MEIFSIILIILAFLLGYNKTNIALWLSVILYPVLNPASFTIIPSDLLYLNIDRVVFAILLGVYLKKRNILNLKFLWKNNFIKVFLIFSLYLILISLEDRLKNIIFTVIPNLYIMILLGFTFVRTQNNYKSLLTILSWQSAFFGVVVLFDFFGVVNLSLLARQLSPSFNEDLTQLNLIRADISRVSGWDGNSIASAYRLAVLVPINLLYIRFSSSKYLILRFIPILLSIVSIVLLMSRSAYLAFFLSIVFLFYYSSTKIEKDIIRKFLLAVRVLIVSLIGITFLYMYIPPVNKVINSMYDYTISNAASKDVQGRQDRIPYAINKFLRKPITGYGSPQFTYNEIMHTDDLPLFILYLLSGGIPLFILFIWWWLKMPFYFLHFTKYKFISKDDRYIIVYVSSAFVAGLIPMLSNWNDRALGLMLIIFGATYKYLLIKKQSFNRIKNHEDSSSWSGSKESK
jgi:hypothetical protein